MIAANTVAVNLKFCALQCRGVPIVYSVGQWDAVVAVVDVCEGQMVFEPGRVMSAADFGCFKRRDV